MPSATTLIALATFGLALVVYRATMLPGVGAWDTAENQTVPALLGTMHPTGFPAYVLLGWAANQVLAPFGDTALRMNLLSGILAAGAGGLSVVVFRRLGAPALVAGAISVAFALAPITWHIGVSADVHSLHLLLVVLLTLLLLRWDAAVRDARDSPGDPAVGRRADRWIVATAAVFGVAVANHALTLLLVPGVAAFVLATQPGLLRRPRLVLAAIGVALGVAALLYLELPLRAGPFRAALVYGHPETPSGLLEILVARQFQGDIVGGSAASQFAALVDLARAQLGPLLYLVPVAFVVTAIRRPRYALYSGLAVLITCVFAATYSNARIDRYYLGPLFFAWSWVAVTVGEIVARVPGTAPDDADGSVAGPDVSRIAVSAVLGLALLVPTAIGIRDRWSEQDLSTSTALAEWLDSAFDAMEPDALVISWWSYSTPMWYGQLVEGRRPDIRIVDDRTRLDEHLGEVADVIEANIDARPVYVIRLQASEVQALEARFTIESVGRPGNLYHVTGRTESTP
ncbi:MAG TPA: DUF2723 domain-containing protein [Candidatus Limnocylindrales bacterium]